MGLKDTVDLEERLGRIEQALARLADGGGAPSPLVEALLRDIAARREAEVRLQHAQDWIQLAQETGGVGAYHYDVKRDLLEWSASCFSLFALDGGAAPTIEQWLSRIHPEDAPNVAKVAADAIQRGKPVNQEYRAVLPDGTVRWIQDRGTVHLDAQGRPDRVVGLNIDVTDLKRAEEEARSAERRATFAARVCGFAAWEADATTKAVRFEPRLATMFGLDTAEGADGWTLHERVHPDDRANNAELFERVKKPGDRFDHEFRVMGRDGGWRRLRAYAEGVATSDGLKVVGATMDVTEEFEAVDALRMSEERLALALEAGGAVGTWDWRVAEDRLSAGGRFHEFFGTSAEDAAKGMPLAVFTEAIHPEDRERVAAAIERAIATGEIYEEEYRVTGGGLVRWVLARGRCHRDAEGRPDRFPGVCVDITERKHGEQRLAYARALIEGIAQGTEEMIAAEDENFRFLFFNDAYQRAFGALWGVDLKVGDSMLEVLAPWPDELARAREIWSRALAGESFNVAMSFGPTPETARTFDLRFSPVLDDAGRRIGAAHILRDVTERLQTEQALRDSEARFRNVAAAIPGLMFVADEEGRNTYVNDGYARYTGLPAERLLDFGWLDVLHPTDRERAAEEWERTRASRTEAQFEYRVRGRDGAYRWFLFTNVPHLDGEGRVLQWAGTATDIEDRKRAERQRELLVGELNHRVKNTLAVVQAIAHQTIGKEGDAIAARRSFEARLRALGEAHDLLTGADWGEVPLRELLERTLHPFAAELQGRFRLVGPEISLNSRATVSLGLAVHELATNATKYGALSNETGAVLVQWSVDGDPEVLRLLWVEEGGPAVATPVRVGFGSRVLRRALAADIGGSVDLDFDPKGLICTITAVSFR